MTARGVITMTTSTDLIDASSTTVAYMSQSRDMSPGCHNTRTATREKTRDKPTKETLVTHVQVPLHDRGQKATTRQQNNNRNSDLLDATLVQYRFFFIITSSLIFQYPSLFTQIPFIPIVFTLFFSFYAINFIFLLYFSYYIYNF
mgnify:CR=1 FL=1